MESKAAVAALSALAQETRLTIFWLLVQQGPAGMAAGRISDALKLAPATLSFHLRELSYAGLVCARQQSRHIYYRADVTAMNKLLAYLAKNCFRESGALQGMPLEPRHIAPPAAKPVVHPKTRAA